MEFNDKNEQTLHTSFLRILKIFNLLDLDAWFLYTTQPAVSFFNYRV